MIETMIKKNIVLLGDSSVGKTSLIRKFVIDQFSDDYITTIGSKVTKKEVSTGPEDDKVYMTLMIWDIIGQRGYRYTQSMSFQGMHGALLVADLTRKDTLSNLMSYWIPQILKMAGPVPMIFLGNKCDLTDDIQFGLPEIQKIADSCVGFGSESVCYLTSAKTGDHVEEAFGDIAELTRIKPPMPKLSIPWNLMDTSEIGDLKDVLDHILADFSDQYGGLEHATPVIKHQMALSGLDLIAPSEVSVLKFVERLAMIESSFKSKEEVEQNRQNRLKLFGYRNR